MFRMFRFLIFALIVEMSSVFSDQDSTYSSTSLSNVFSLLRTFLTFQIVFSTSTYIPFLLFQPCLLLWLANIIYSYIPKQENSLGVFPRLNHFCFWYINLKIWGLQSWPSVSTWIYSLELHITLQFSIKQAS